MVVAGIVAPPLPPIAARRGNQLMFILAALAVSTVGCVALAVVPGSGLAMSLPPHSDYFCLSVLPIVLEMVEERAGAAVSTATSAVWLAGNGGGVLVSGLIGLFLGTPRSPLSSWRWCRWFWDFRCGLPCVGRWRLRPGYWVTALCSGPLVALCVMVPADPPLKVIVNVSPEIAPGRGR